MDMYDRGRLSNRLDELNDEEISIENHLKENYNSLSQDQIQRLEDKLIGVRSEKGQISHLMWGGFY